MKLTDKEAIRLVKRARSYDLEDSIENAPQDEVKVCDLQFVADEVSWILDSLRSWSSPDPTARGYELKEAKELLRKTKNGKVNWLVKDSRGHYKNLYEDYQIEDARKIVNEHRRLERLYENLKTMGYCGQWL